MKSVRFTSLVIELALLAFVAAATAAEEQVVKFGLSADYYSKYIWRGQNINDESVFQPAVSISAYGFTGSIWGNMDLTNGSQTASGNSWEFSEFDYTLDYTAAVPNVDWLNLSVGTIYYRFPNTTYDPTTEIYGGLSLSGVPLSPSFKWYRDIDEIKGSYFQFGVGHTFEKLAEWSDKCYCGLQLGASVGWGSSAYNDGYFGVDSGKFNDLTLSTGLCVQIDSWMVRPSVNYATMLSDSIREATEKTDNIWMGIGLSTSF
ncbi:MAG: hypothetical protein MUO27_02015 [Sedimentisphaerales bacterium]|nr:hypothetical protein [Sedimentisphaerales bacterium]